MVLVPLSGWIISGPPLDPYPSYFKGCAKWILRRETAIFMGTQVPSGEISHRELGRHPNCARELARAASR
jgi:hypothetical protein